MKEEDLGCGVIWREEENANESELEKAAKRYATEGDEISGLYIIESEVDAFKAGAEWKKQQMINKGVEWLEENICEYCDGEDIEYTASMTYNIAILQNERLSNEFKKAMEKE